MTNNDWKKRLGLVYSTNPDVQYETTEVEEPETLPKNQQKLRVRIERSGRNGKTVTLISGFIGKSEDLKDLSRAIKTKLSTGGSMKDNDIIIQGDGIYCGILTEVLMVINLLIVGRIIILLIYLIKKLKVVELIGMLLQNRLLVIIWILEIF
jgi:translation initiation factor 1